MNFLDRYFKSHVDLLEKALDHLYGLKGKKVDFKEAFNLFTLSAEMGNNNARRALESMFKPGRPELADDYAEVYETMRNLRLAEEAGDSEATYLVNVTRLNDDNDDYLYNKGIAGIKYAASNDYPPALYVYACELNSGRRIPEDKELSLRMLRRAAELGHVRSLHTLYFQVGETELAVKYAKALANGAHPEVMDILGDFLRKEGKGSQAIALYETAAALGCRDSMYTLGLLCEHGEFVEPDLYNALMWYQRAADEGHTEAMVCLANIMRHGPEEFRDPEGAFEQYKKAAEARHPEAWNEVGDCYMMGFGVERSVAKARESYLKAAEIAYPANAYFNLYYLYCEQEDVKDPREALSWLDKAAQTGYPLACWRYGLHYLQGDGVSPDYNTAYRWFKEAEKEDYAPALYEIGRMYLHGVVVERDPREAFKRFRLSADDYVPSMEMLGSCYCGGIGCNRDPEKGYKCFKEAADKGNIEAMFDLGLCYRLGEGVEPDIDKSIEWYEKAIEYGHPRAMSNCALIFDKGIGVEPDLDRAFSLYKRAADLGNPEGQFGLGSMYFEGRGVDQDYPEAVKWFTEAAKSGEPDSLYHLAICYNEGLGVEQDSFKAVQYLYESADKGWAPAIDLIREHNIPRLDSEN